MAQKRNVIRLLLAPMIHLQTLALEHLFQSSSASHFHHSPDKMFYSAAVFAALLTGGNAFSMPKAPQRMTGLKMAEAWFPDAATSNTVGMDTLA
jgi:hypothetical protein